jgi:hypothetical protein
VNQKPYRPPVALSGAVIASLIGTLWVLHYLLTTTYGLMMAGTPLLNYVLGQAHNLEVFGAEATFVVISRFLIAFGLSWAPLTAIIGAIRWIFHR